MLILATRSTSALLLAAADSFGSLGLAPPLLGALAAIGAIAAAGFDCGRLRPGVLPGTGTDGVELPAPATFCAEVFPPLLEDLRGCGSPGLLEAPCSMHELRASISLRFLSVASLIWTSARANACWY